MLAERVVVGAEKLAAHALDAAGDFLRLSAQALQARLGRREAARARLRLSRAALRRRALQSRFRPCLGHCAILVRMAHPGHRPARKGLLKLEAHGSGPGMASPRAPGGARMAVLAAPPRRRYRKALKKATISRASA